MSNITAEELKNFKEHKVWKEVETWLKERKEAAKSRSLTIKTFEELQEIQTECRTYDTILNKINKLAKEAE